MSPVVSPRRLKDDQEQAASLGEITKGLVLFSVSIALYSVYALMIKVMMQKFTMNAPELTYYVSLLMVVTLCFSAKLYQQDIFNIAKGAQFDLFCRALWGFFSDILLFLAFKYTAYSKAFCLFFTCPLIAPFIARCLIGEKVKLWDIIAIILSFIGTVMLVQPFKEVEEPKTVVDASGQLVVDNSAANDLIGCGIAILAAVFAALAVVFLKKLADQVHFTLVPMYNLLGATLLSPIWSLISPVTKVDELPEYSWLMFLFVVASVLVSFIQQGTMAKSM